MSTDDAGREARGQIARVAAEQAAVATASAINPVLGVLAATSVSVMNSGLLPEWLRLLTGAMKTSDVSIDPNDARTAAAFNRFTISAVQTARHDKRQMLAAAMLNTIRSDDASDFMVNHLADLVIRFTVEHVQVLQAIADPESRGISRRDLVSESLRPALANLFHDSDAEILVDAVLNDLETEDLIETDFAAGFTNVVDGNEQADTPVNISAKGTRFLDYLTL